LHAPPSTASYDFGVVGFFKMPFDATRPIGECTVCGSRANILLSNFGVGEVVDCSRCGDFRISHVDVDSVWLPFTELKKLTLASYTIRKLQKPGNPRPQLSLEFFRALESRSLPSPAERMDNLLRTFAEKADESPGQWLVIPFDDASLLGKVGATSPNDLQWSAYSLNAQGFVLGAVNDNNCRIRLTPLGWNRVDELKRAHVASRYAFFARQFKNDDLDKLFEGYLRRAVVDTGYELRTVTQKAGHIDAIIEDEIRRCRFLIADLSDDNAGAYWEAGFAEGLGKDVIYICREKDQSGVSLKTHFDTDHRQTVRWDLASPEAFVKQIKAVIRNTLLGDANQA
jgi:hypothetical protein